MLHRGSGRTPLAEKLPNLRVVIRDRPHSSRCLNGHSLAADPILHSLLQTAALKPYNTVQQIRGSQPLHQIFVAEARSRTRRDDRIATVTGVPVAAQRFGSRPQPLGWLLLNLEARLSYSHVVSREAGPRQWMGQGRLGFLQRITDQNVILLGMVADASDDRTLHGSWTRTLSTSASCMSSFSKSNTASAICS